MNQITTSFGVRILTLGIGAISNFVVATLLLDSFGNEGYAVWVILTSLPSLIPFADLGLGSNIFNYFADKSQRREAQNNVTEVFLLSIFFSFFFILILAFFIFVLTNVSYATSRVTSKDLFVGFCIIAITFIAVPFSLAAKKMFAEERIITVFLIQGLMPPITAFATFILLSNDTQSVYFLVFVPSITYLITTLAIFKVSAITKCFAFTNFDKFRRNIRKSLSLGGWSLCVTTVTALVWQAPKYLIQAFGSPVDLTSYSLMSLFLIPGLSLTAVVATWNTTRVRRRGYSADVTLMTNRSIRISQIASVIFSISAFLGFQLMNKVGLVTPDYRSQFIAFVALISCSTWMIPLSTFTSKLDLRWIAIRIIPCFMFSILMLAVLIKFDYSLALLFYVLLLNASISFFSVKRLRNLQDLQEPRQQTSLE